MARSNIILSPFKNWNDLEKFFFFFFLNVKAKVIIHARYC